MAAIAAGQIYPFLDPVGGCLVSLLIIRVGYQSGHAACQEIVDRGLDHEVLHSIREGAEVGLTQSLKDIPVRGMTLGSIKGTKSGAYYIVDVEVEGPGQLTLDQFETIRSGVVTNVKEHSPGVKIVRVFATTQKSNGNGIEG